jgi:hypothetical protein
MCQEPKTMDAFRSRVRASCKTCQTCRSKNALRPTWKRARRRAWYKNEKKRFMAPGCREKGCTVKRAFMEIFGQFDHLSGKKFGVCNWWFTARSEAEFHKEVDKCRPMCPAHHLLHSEVQRELKKKKNTYSKDPAAVKSRRLRRRNKEHNNERKRQARECHLCGLVCCRGNEVSFQWDHKQPNEKFRSVSLLLHSSAIWRIDHEIVKCRLLCANCAVEHDCAQTKQQQEEGFLLRERPRFTRDVQRPQPPQTPQ